MGGGVEELKRDLEILMRYETSTSLGEISAVSHSLATLLSSVMTLMTDIVAISTHRYRGMVIAVLHPSQYEYYCIVLIVGSNLMMPQQTPQTLKHPLIIITNQELFQSRQQLWHGC